MAERQLPEGWQDAVVETIESHIIGLGEARNKVVSCASHMIDAITDEAAGAHPLASNPVGELASAPDVLPALGWEVFVPRAGEGGGGWNLHIVGNAGEYFTHVFSNERPAAIFNSGFYAGVLAVKAGLVDPELFHHDSERKQPPGVAEFDAEAEAARMKEMLRTFTPEELAEAERFLGYLDFSAEVSNLCDRLGEVGWVFAGGENPKARTLSIGFGLPEHLAHIGGTVFLHLPIRDKEGNLFPGYEFSLDEETGALGMGYEGPLDDRFKQVVDAMVEVAKPPETEQRG